jgi:hypothetical protein
MAELGQQAIFRRVSALIRQRLTWVFGIFILVHLAHIAAFWPYHPGAVTTAERWRNEISFLHTAFLVFPMALMPAKLVGNCLQSSSMARTIRASSSVRGVTRRSCFFGADSQW